jgi:acyl-CoA thioesterase
MGPVDDTQLSPVSVESLMTHAEASPSGRTLSIDETWLQGRSWYGGLQLALAMKSIRDEVGSSIPLRSLHASFIAPISHQRPALARAEILRAGRSVTQARGTVEQDGKSCFEMIAILGNSRDSEMNYDSNSPLPINPDSSRRLTYIEGMTPNCTQHYDIRFIRGEPPFSQATDARATIIARPAVSDLSYTEADFLAISDIIPPPVISLMKKRAPISSMNCALEIIRPEAIFGTAQWVRFESEVHDCHSGYAWQTARLYSEEGVLLAISHQSVAVFS